jgi:hypothetical protein
MTPPPPMSLDELRAAGAEFSPCRVYRYQLHRNIPQPAPAIFVDSDGSVRPEDVVRAAAKSSRLVLFIMLNPSTADETLNDPTIRRCIGFAKGWGFRHLAIGNLFALRSTDPRALYSTPHPEGPDNDRHINAMAEEADLVIAAWGVHGALRDRGAIVRGRLHARGVDLHHLGLTKDGHPKHPLYLAGSTKPTPWAAESPGSLPEARVHEEPGR